MQVELFERHLRNVLDAHRHLPGFRVGDGLGDQLRVDAEAVEDHEQRGTGCPATVRRCRASRSSGSSSAGVCTSIVPIFELSGHCPGRFGAEFRLGVGARGLAVGGVGVDREAFGQGHGRRAERRRRRRFAGEELVGLQLEVEPAGASASAVVRLDVEDRVEPLVFAAGRRRIGGDRPWADSGPDRS